MRTLTLILTALSLTACGEGSALDERFKTSFREKLVTTCTATAVGQIPAGVEIDLDQLCACAADKIMEGKTAKELMTTVPGSAEDLAKVQTCVSELAPIKIDVAK